MNRATLPPGANIGGQYSILIIDSGVDTTHSLLKTASIETFAFQSDGPPLLESGVDEFGHGTAIAGLIHAISPDTIIHSLRVFGRSLTAQSQTVLAALSWGIAQGYPIINCSFGTTERQLLPAFKSLVDAAYRRKQMRRE